EESRHVLDHRRLRRWRREDARWGERHGCRADPDLGEGQARAELRHDPVVVGVHHELVEASEGGGAVPHVLAHSAALRAWYKATGVFPADKRFQASLVKDPLGKQRLKLNLSPVSVWPENFVPP